jgi:peptidoglycan/xylan/chitin deacetylase (PgdA/CDA1 family)
MLLGVTVLVHAALLLLLVGSTPLSVVVLLGYGAYHGSMAWGVMHPRSRLFGPNRSRLATDERHVALTFDDGPHPEITPQVLAILRDRGVKATFFLVGKWVERHPEIVRRIVADGHGLGNHTHGHSYLFWASTPRRLLREVARAQETITAAAGSPCRWFRAPVGLKSVFLHRALRRLGLELISWDLRFLERAALDRARMREHLEHRIVPGSILLLHDGHDRKPEGNPAVLAALPLVLDALDDLGYRCVPLA